VTKYHLGGFGVTVVTDGPLLIQSEPLEAAALTGETCEICEINWYMQSTTYLFSISYADT
jgi:hypothetical protein